MNEPSQHIRKLYHTAKTRQIISAHQMQKLVKNNEPVFLAVAKTSNDFILRGRGAQGREKESPGYAVVNFAHGMTEGQKKKIKKESGPKKDIITVKEQEREVLNSVPTLQRKSLEKLIREYRDVFPEKLTKGAPTIEVQHHVEIALSSEPPIGLLTDWVLLSGMR